MTHLRGDLRKVGVDLKNLVITERDKELFRYVNEQRYLVSGQIYQIFWPHSDTRSGTARQRLDKLVEAGYLKTNDVLIPKNKRLRLFLLTEKGIDILRCERLDHGFKEIEFVNPLAVKHTLKLTNVRALFGELGQSDWMSERLIRVKEAGRGWFPDGILRVKGLRIAIELDNSFKAKPRYVRRFYLYKWAKDFELAVFIFSWESVRDWVFDLDAPQDKVCFVHYDDLIQKKLDAELSNATSRITLRSIFR